MRTYTPAQRRRIKTMISDLVRATSGNCILDTDSDVVRLKFEVLKSECSSYCKRTGQLLTMSEFVEMFM